MPKAPSRSKVNAQRSLLSTRQFGKNIIVTSTNITATVIKTIDSTSAEMSRFVELIDDCFYYL